MSKGVGKRRSQDADEDGMMQGKAGTEVSRRAVIGCSVCGAAGAALGASSMAWAADAAAATSRGQEVLREFPYGTVRLTGGRIKEHYDCIQAH